NNKLGVPCVFFPDYYAPGNLKYIINGLMEAHERYIFGATQVDYLSRFSSPYSANYISGGANTSLIYQTSYAISGREVVVAINFSGNTLKVDQTINTANIHAGDTLTDIFSQTIYPTITVQGDNQIYLEIPPRSFAVYVEGDLRDELIDISTPVAISNYQAQQQFAIFPNPANNDIYFSPLTQNALLEVYDMAGKRLLQASAGIGDNHLDISMLPSGTYLLKMIAQDNMAIAKFIRQ
ncbi:MAG TPA: T9SS type A sorting domain-containing protein, partial [Chitinophagales bacterium]|nr:T9SS type A sorting domain-containing protein [Chitinophagales bacterium]